MIEGGFCGVVENYYKKEHVIKGYECDFQGDMKFPALMNYLIELSGEHWDATVGKTKNNPLAKGDLTWILIYYQAELTKIPKKDEKIYLATEYSSYNRLFAYRNFDVLDEEGKVIIQIESVFALMDLDSRRMVKLKDEYFESLHLKGFKSSRMKRYPDIADLSDDPELLERDYYVRYYDIDSNQHVNNTLYLDWGIDVLGRKFLSQHQLTFAAIKFDKEVHYEDYIHSKATLIEDPDRKGAYISSHRIETEGKLNAEIEFHWVSSR